MDKHNNEYKQLKLGSKVMVHAYKLNGWLYRAWEYPILIHEDDQKIVLDASKAWIFSSEEKSIRSFKTKVNKPTYWYFFKREWFNVIASQEEQGIKFYINIASPYIYEQEAIKYYDFDLDFKILTDNTWREVDVNEFITNAKKYGYDDKLVKIIRRAEEKLKVLVTNDYFKKLINHDNLKVMLDHYNSCVKKRS